MSPWARLKLAGGCEGHFQPRAPSSLGINPGRLPGGSDTRTGLVNPEVSSAKFLPTELLFQHLKSAGRSSLVLGLTGIGTPGGHRARACACNMFCESGPHPGGKPLWARAFPSCLAPGLALGSAHLGKGFQRILRRPQVSGQEAELMCFGREFVLFVPS